MIEWAIALVSFAFGWWLRGIVTAARMRRLNRLHGRLGLRFGDRIE